jgi:predicted TIM-barrel fold metal-dependent hydrolase
MDSRPATRERRRAAGNELKRFAARIRQVGVKRVLFGTDLGPPYARQEWLTFRTTVPLTDDEMRTIAANMVPYF